MTVTLLAIAFFVEDRRARPLLWVRWFAKSDILLFSLIAVVMRVALTEQTYSAVAAIADAEAQLLKAKADMARASDLVADGAISIRERDETSAALAQAEARLKQANANMSIAHEDLRTVDVARSGLAAQVEVAKAQLRLAEIDLLHTVIRAPEGGQLGEVHVRVGQYVTNGSELVELVPPDRWVTAEYALGGYTYRRRECFAESQGWPMGSVYGQ